ncbi:hypothetical protein OZX73_06030 [Bifidobacterium sp. ESL0775]|uniref:hypothetical protein n=1 Tax=Bifidobacterium sp. ESL0775 TaxID=2983230 RepID=UPI0023F7B437|nr:hypothetical protein [Bifidobacterium sp. ESL0775]WEV68845.1 hypothetical protein OZX73_06030 [Bifidobacterium sp. ESL0775]
MAGVNLGKYSFSKAVAIIFHVLRLGERHSNPHIDQALTRLNVVLSVDGEDLMARLRRIVGEVRAAKPPGRRWRKDTVVMCSMVYDLPEDFPHPDDRGAVIRFFRGCLTEQSAMAGGWGMCVGGVIHYDEVHDYVVPRSQLEAEGVPAGPDDPPVTRTSRIHMHAMFVPATSPEQIERINGTAPRTRSRRGRAPQGVWFDCNRLVTRKWLRELNRRIQALARDRFDCHYESTKASYSSNAEVEKLKMDSAVAAEVAPLARRTLEVRKKAQNDALKAHKELETTECRRTALDKREKALDAREASLLEWLRETCERFVTALRSWLSHEMARAKTLVEQARREGYEQGYRAGVEKGAAARPVAPPPEKEKALEALGRMLDDEPGLLPRHASGRLYTADEWRGLPPARRRELLDRMEPDTGRGRSHERVL